MPKSRKRRGAKKYRGKSKILQASRSHPSAPPANTPSSTGLLARLYANDAEPLSQLLRFFPLVSASWVAVGAALVDATLFGLVLTIAAASHFLWLRSLGGYLLLDSRYAEPALAIVGAVAAAALFFVTDNGAAAILAVLYLTLGVLRPRLRPMNGRTLFLFTVAEVVQLMILAVLGGFSQLRTLVLSLCVIGFIPGGFIAAARLARYAALLEAEGWHRSYLGKMKNGMDVVKPGALGRLFGFLLILGPLAPIALSPANLLPPPLLLAAIALYPMPNVATAFLERLRSDDSISVSCVKLAAVASALTAVGGILARY